MVLVKRRLCLAAGFAGFEPAFDAEGPLSPKAGDSGARELRALADSEGVRLPSLASGLYWQHPLTAEGPAARKTAEDIVRAQLDCAAALGVGAILVVPGTVGRGFWGGSECTAYADAYARAQ